MSNVVVKMGKSFGETGLSLFGGGAHRVADLSAETVRFGRKEIDLAEHEMPGLIACREEFGVSKPLAGTRITGSFT